MSCKMVVAVCISVSGPGQEVLGNTNSTSDARIGSMTRGYPPCRLLYLLCDLKCCK